MRVPSSVTEKRGPNRTTHTLGPCRRSGDSRRGPTRARPHPAAGVAGMISTGAAGVAAGGSRDGVATEPWRCASRRRTPWCLRFGEVGDASRRRGGGTAGRGLGDALDQVPVAEEGGVVLERAANERVEDVHDLASFGEPGLEPVRRAAPLASARRAVGDDTDDGIGGGAQLRDEVGGESGLGERVGVRRGRGAHAVREARELLRRRFAARHSQRRELRQVGDVRRGDAGDRRHVIAQQRQAERFFLLRRALRGEVASGLLAGVRREVGDGGGEPLPSAGVDDRGELVGVLVEEVFDGTERFEHSSLLGLQISLLV